MPLFGPPNIEKMKAKQDAKGLIKALSYRKDDHIRHQAALALCEVGGQAVVEPLITVLNDRLYKIDVRRYAAEALGKAGGAQAVVPLIDFLVDTHEHITVVEALKKIGLPAVDPLISALKNRNWCVRKAVAEVLGTVGDPRVVKALIATLGDRERDVRLTAAKALVSIYQGDKPDSKIRQLILAHRSEILQPHIDRSGGGCAEMFPHADEGIGIDFPL